MAPGRRGLIQREEVRAARNLLFDLLEGPEPVLSGLAFRVYFADAGRLLIEAGLLVAEGHEAVTQSDDHEDSPLTLTWSPEHRRHGYFSQSRGWVTVDPAAITRYRVDIEATLNLVFERLQPRSSVHPIAGALAWGAGDIRLPHRTHRVPLWFARRVGDPEVWSNARELLLAHPATRRRLIVVSTPGSRLPTNAPQGNILLSLRDLIEGEPGFALDPSVLAAAMAMPVINIEPTAALVIQGDGREVRFYGESFTIGGEKQRRIIRFLDQCYRDGRRKVSVAEVIAELDLPTRARIRDYFKGPAGQRVMRNLLFEESGLCGFRFEDAAPG